MEEQGYGFVVVEALVRYRKAAFFDDELTLRTELAGLSKASLRFEYEAIRSGDVISTGYTRHACVELPGGRLIRTPDRLLRLAPGASWGGRLPGPLSYRERPSDERSPHTRHHDRRLR